MSDCPLVRLATYIRLLKQFEQTGQVVIPVDDWLWFFEALAYLKRDGSQREIYCAFAGEYIVFSKTPIERKAKKQPHRASFLSDETARHKTPCPAFLFTSRIAAHRIRCARQPIPKL